MYSTEKAVIKLKRNRILGVTFFMFFGISNFVLNLKAGKSFFEDILLIYSILTVLIVLLFLFISNKRIKEIKGQHFSLNKDGILINNNSNIEQIKIEVISSLTLAAKELTIKIKSGEEIKIKLSNYLLTSDQSKDLDLEIESLREKISLTP